MSGTFGVIAPHPPIMVDAVGGRRVGEIVSTREGMRIEARALREFDPDLVVVMSPHASAAADAFLIDGSQRLTGSLAQFGDPTRYSYRGDTEFAAELAGELAATGIPAALRAEVSGTHAGDLDHGVLVPMSFLDPDALWPLVVLSLSYLSYAMHIRLGEAVARTAERLDRRVAFVASGDLSHRLKDDGPYAYSPFGPELDRAIAEKVESGALRDLARIDERVIEGGGECGLRSFLTLGGFAGPAEVPTRLLSYEGPWGVGYLTALVGSDAVAMGTHSAADTPPTGRKGGAPGDDHSEIVRLARRTIDLYVREGAVPDAGVLDDPALPARAGAFVTLHSGGQLRGCIGTIAPTAATLAEEVVHNAVQAATRDPRFEPVSEEELEGLDLKVDVLHPAERVHSLGELDPKQYGVIVSSGYRRGLLLPDLEGVDDAETQVSIAMKKGGISPSEEVVLERFKVDRYS